MQHSRKATSQRKATKNLQTPRLAPRKLAGAQGSVSRTREERQETCRRPVISASSGLACTARLPMSMSRENLKSTKSNGRQEPAAVNVRCKSSEAPPRLNRVQIEQSRVSKICQTAGMAPYCKHNLNFKKTLYFQINATKVTMPRVGVRFLEICHPVITI